MEEDENYSDEEPETSVLLQNQEANFGVSTQDEANLKVMELNEDFNGRESQSQDEEVMKSEKQQRIKLQKDLTALVTNIQAAADAEESMRRTEIEEARRVRLEQLENDVKSSREKFEEISRGWSTAKEKVIHQELQEALNKQQQLCSAIIEDKKRLINDLKQELKVRDDRYVKDLRRQAEELDLTIERMEEQIKILKKAYREELAQMERVCQHEMEDLLTRDKAEWEQHMNELWDQELERLMERKKKVEEYETDIQSLMLKSINKQTKGDIVKDEQIQVLDREYRELKNSVTILNLKLRRKNYDHKFNLTDMRKRIVSLESEIKKKKSIYDKQKKQFTQKSHYLSEEYKRHIQQQECLQKKIRHFADIHARKCRDMWLMIDAEVKQLVDKALFIDSLICKHLALSWERPPVAFMDPTAPINPQKQACRSTHQSVSQLFQTAHCSQGSMQTSAESMGTEQYKEGVVVQSESGALVEGVELSVEAMKNVMELLCDEAGFLMDDKLLQLLAPLEREEQAVVKLGSFISSLGIEEEDLPKLAQFLLKYKQQTELDGSSFSTQQMASSRMTSGTTDIIHPNQVLPALKCFLEQHRMSRKSSTSLQRSFFHPEAWDSSENKAYWQSMGNIISDHKVQLWKAAENILKQYLAVLKDISKLAPETESLKQQNAELRMLLQQSLNS